MNAAAPPVVTARVTAALAPPVEWLLRAGWVAHEIADGGPLRVRILGPHHVRVEKSLGMFRESDDDAVPSSRLDVHLELVTHIAEPEWDLRQHPHPVSL